jgi:hypothetical protein
MLPALFFGNGVNGGGFSMEFYSVSGQPSAFVQHYRTIESELAEQESQPGIQEYRSAKVACKQESQNIRQLEASKSKLDVILEKLHLKKNRLNARREQLNAQLQNLHSQHNTLLKNPAVQKQLQEQMKRDMITKFQQMNQAMSQATGQSYPEPVLRRLAAMTADCLSMDPSRRPTAEQVLLALQNMGLSSWSEGQFNIEGVPESEPGSDQARIQAENLQNFPWIYGNMPPPPEVEPAAPAQQEAETPPEAEQGRHRRRRRRREEEAAAKPLPDLPSPPEVEPTASAQQGTETPPEAVRHHRHRHHRKKEAAAKPLPDSPSPPEALLPPEPVPPESVPV